MDLPQFKTAIENGDLFFNQRSEHDYLVHNTDGTKSIGFWQPKRDIAQEWVNHCQSRMRAGQIEHILVARPEAGDDANSAVMSYSERLDAGLIPPYSVT